MIVLQVYIIWHNKSKILEYFAADNCKIYSAFVCEWSYFRC